MGLATPQNLYHTMSKIIENSGFKDVQNFIQDPKNAPPAPPPPPPLPLQIEQMKIQADAQKHQAESQNDISKFQAETQMTKEVEQMKSDQKMKEIQANLELQASNDQRDSERETHKAEMEALQKQNQLEFDKWKVEFTEQNKIYIEEMKIRGMPASDAMQEQSNMTQVLSGLQAVIGQMSAPKMIVRDANGKAVGVQHIPEQ